MVRVRLIGLALLAVAPRVHAQSQVTPAGAPAFILVGSVVSNDGSPVMDAEIRVIQSDAHERLYRSDSAGKLTASDLTTKDVTVRVRRLGFQSRSLEVTFPAHDRRRPITVNLPA